MSNPMLYQPWIDIFRIHLKDIVIHFTLASFENSESILKFGFHLKNYNTTEKL